MGPMIQEVDELASNGATETPPGELTITDLTEVEARLRRLLLNAGKYVADLDGAEPPTLRFTGGWVRDKLLGVDSHDIDVAISTMTGYQFGLRLHEYLEIPGNMDKHQLVKDDVRGLHQIKANPEKSKHLETVTTKILGLDIDLVNLRKETYTEDSRNPQMEFGTPEEDALRRDATVNAMFYNLDTQQIEDFTGKGRQDMRDHIIRTPLEPYQTFKDDPLRVLRLIRFASRLGYTIEATARKAMKDADIKDALRRKISRERVGIELEKALRGPDPKTAMELIFQLNLYETIFSDPELQAQEHYTPDEDGWRLVIDHLQELVESGSESLEILVRNKDEKYLAWLLTALLPYRDAPQAPPPVAGKRAPDPIASQVAAKGIKSTNKICDVITASVKNQGEIAGLVDRFNEQKRRPEKKLQADDATARDVLGMAIRRWGSTWRSQMIWALMAEVAEQPEQAEAIDRKYNSFLQYLSELALLEVCALKPILDGKALAAALSTSPGPWMKEALDVVMAYQLRNPDNASTVDAISEVKDFKKRGELTSSLVRHFLRLTIRPLFSKVKPATVTNEGRRNDTHVLPPKLTTDSMDESKTRPWKSKAGGNDSSAVLHLLQWVVNSLDGVLLEEVWPLVVPPVLTLLDDWQMPFRTMGAQLLGQLLKVTHPNLLRRTGLGEVFEDALVHCLTYLPPSTPQIESALLLKEGFPALFSLVNTMYPKETELTTTGTTQPKGKTMDPNDSRERQRTQFLDNVLRKGVLHGYDYAHNFTNVTAVLFEQLSNLSNELGIETVRHMKYVLPMLTQALSRPVSGLSAEKQGLGEETDEASVSATDAEASAIRAALMAAKAMQATILNAWPRMVGWRGQVLKGLTLCWINFDMTAGDEADGVRNELREAVGMLRAALESNEEISRGQWEEETSMLVEADSRLRGLFEGV